MEKPERYSLAHPVEGGYQWWAVNDMEKMYAVVSVSASAPYAEEIARFAFAKIAGSDLDSSGKLLREYRRTPEKHSACLIRTAGLVSGSQIDDRCELCKRADALPAGGGDMHFYIDSRGAMDPSAIVTAVHQALARQTKAGAR